jgi:flagella basal body P-ring formation protein FlgA
MRIPLMCLLSVAGLVVAFSRPATSAEIQLKTACQPTGNLVLLGDVASVYASDEEVTKTLRAMELLPAPVPGSRRHLRVREIQDLLRARGVNLAEHQFSGASRVVVGGDSAPRKRRLSGRLDPGAVKRTHQQVAAAIVEHLRSVASSDEPWQVQVELDDRQVRRLLEAQSRLTAEGGARPWVGAQTFVVRAASATGETPVTLEAQVSLPAAVVVAARPLARGTVIRASDVQLQHGVGQGRHGGRKQAIRSIAGVVGRETTVAVAAGQMLDRGSVRRPLLVQRNDPVTVYARAAGIVARTVARAREEGSQGDLVMVESMRDRKTRYLARVTGVREVEVYAGSTRAGETDPAAGQFASGL